MVFWWSTNHIHYLNNEDGKREEDIDLSKMAVDYFVKLLTQDPMNEDTQILEFTPT